jgi:hypothetical protein
MIGHRSDEIIEAGFVDEETGEPRESWLPAIALALLCWLCIVAVALMTVAAASIAFGAAL